MKANRFMSSNSGDMNMVNAGIFLVVLLVILYVGVNIIQNVSNATSLDAGEYATGVLTFSDNVTTGELVNITDGSATYTFEFNTTGTGATAGYINVDVSSGYNTSVLASGNLTDAINAEATISDLITAVNTTDTTTITADAVGTAANSYGTTETGADTAWASTTMTGGIASDTMYQTSTDLDGTTEDAYSMAAIMPIVMIAVAVLAGLLGILYLFR